MRNEAVEGPTLEHREETDRGGDGFRQPLGKEVNQTHTKPIKTLTNKVTLPDTSLTFFLKNCLQRSTAILKSIQKQ